MTGKEIVIARDNEARCVICGCLGPKEFKFLKYDGRRVVVCTKHHGVTSGP